MTSQQITTNVVRRTYLNSRKGFRLRVTDDLVDGSQNYDSDVYSKWNPLRQMASVAPGEVVFRGEVSNKYIGMDSNGNIVTYNSLLEDCVFKEHQDANGYSSFESKPHPGWFLGLTNDGKTKPGPKSARGHRAVEFLPSNV
ncbi:fibroblast growth factor 1-like [Stylophora pistillata]|uniref:fibroblast growth factor 1-like n=1 Tax=Stylophora pistillata TaxID=50429 RepID=UPI000C0394D0|nr:fibroblast growth factor 1-like [Stylophora pistillata]